MPPVPADAARQKAGVDVMVRRSNWPSTDQSCGRSTIAPIRIVVVRPSPPARAAGLVQPCTRRCACSAAASAMSPRWNRQPRSSERHLTRGLRRSVCITVRVPVPALLRPSFAFHSGYSFARKFFGHVPQPLVAGAALDADLGEVVLHHAVAVAEDRLVGADLVKPRPHRPARRVLRRQRARYPRGVSSCGRSSTLMPVIFTDSKPFADAASTAAIDSRRSAFRPPSARERGRSISASAQRHRLERRGPAAARSPSRRAGRTRP